MSIRLVAMIASCVLLTGCAQETDRPAVAGNPVGPTAVTGSGPAATSTPSASNAFVPFHSELTCERYIPGSDISLCPRPAPAGTIYLARNTNICTATSTHLGKGEYENHTCVYGAPETGPQGWLADIRWTAANGDVLVATSDFLYWTGAPGRSVAVDKVTFHDGGTGRFQFAEGDGMCYVDAPARTAVYEGELRYGKTDK